MDVPDSEGVEDADTEGETCDIDGVTDAEPEGETCEADPLADAVTDIDELNVKDSETDHDPDGDT